MTVQQIATFFRLVDGFSEQDKLNLCRIFYHEALRQDAVKHSNTGVKMAFDLFQQGDVKQKHQMLDFLQGKLKT